MKEKKKTGHPSSADLRKRAEEELRESEERYRRLIETAPDVIYNLSAEDGTFTLLNPAFERITGWSRAEWLGKPFMPLVHPDDLTLAREAFQQVSRGESIPPYELRILSKSGEYLIGEFTSFPHIEKRKVLGEFGIARDITERKRAEEALQFMRVSLDNAADTMACIRRDGRFVDVNKAFCRMVGYSREELLSMTVHDIDPDYQAEMWPGFWERLKQAGSLMFESLHRTKDGRDFPVEIIATFFEYNGREYHCSFARDITERKGAEEALRESEMRFREVVENIHEVFWIRDFDTRRILYVSPEYETIWGHALEEVYAKGLSFMENVHPEDEERISLSRKALYEEGRPFDEEYRIIRPDHSIRWVRARTYPVFNENMKVSRLAGISEDITERKLVEEALRTSKSKLRTLSLELSHAEERERRRLALFLHDEIGQSLALLRMKLGEYAGGLEFKSGKHDIGQICDVLEKAIDQTHTLTFELSPPILHQLGLEAAIEWAGEKISQDQGIDFIFNDDGRLKPLDVDLKAFLFRCIRELMMNIVKHAKARRMAVSLTMTQNQVYATVEDNGIGFDTSLLERQPERVGFGLFSIRERLAAVDGTFEIRSAAGRGTRVALSIPVK